MSRPFHAVITAEFTKESPAISYYMELTRSDGVTYRIANFDVNWHNVAGTGTLGFSFTEPIVWDGSSTQRCKISIPRTLTLNVLGADIGTLALSNVLRNGTIKLWMRGGLDAELATALAAGKLAPWFSGRIIGCDTSPEAVDIECSTEYQAQGMTPLIRVSPPTFNYAPAPGATIAYDDGYVQLTTEGT